MTLALDEAVDRFDRAVTTARREDALGVVDALLADGVDPMTVLVDVVAAVQREVGARWQRGEWSVAQEHAATAVSVSALELVARSARSSVPQRGRVVVACAEHEWHALPAHIIAAGLQAAGWETTVLGASTPTARLSRYLQDLGPDVTAISCSVAPGLPASRAFIEASTTAGIPVLAGGAAFGPDARRASSLGATAWAPDLRGALEVIDTLPLVVRAAAPLPREVTAEQTALLDDRHRLVEAATRRWIDARAARGSAPVEDEEDLLSDTVHHALHAVVGALITGDGRLVEETAGWVDTVLEPRGVQGPSVADLRDSLGAELARLPLASRLWQRHWPA